MSSSSPAFSPNKPPKPEISCTEVAVSNEEQLKKLFKSFRSCEINNPVGDSGDLSKVCCKSLFSYGYYSNFEFFGLFNG